MFKKDRSYETLIADYLDNLLPDDLKAKFEKRLKESPALRKAVDEMRALREKAKEATDGVLSPEAKLRLYERLNEERARRGEALLKIPQELLALAKAKAVAASEAAAEVAEAGAQVVQTAAKGGAKTVETAARSAAETAKRLGDAGKAVVEGGSEMAHTGLETAADVASTLSESAEVVKDVVDSPVKGAVTAPPKLAGKMAKVGFQTAKGMAKTGAKAAQTGIKAAAETGKAAAEAAKGTSKTTAEAVKAAAETAKAGAGVLSATVNGAKKVAKAKDEEEN